MKVTHVGTPYQVAQRVRNDAINRGYAVQKSRRALSHDNYGAYRLIDIDLNAIVLGEKYDATIDEIAEWLKDKPPIWAKE